MIPEAHVSHESNGRLRIKIPSRKGDLSYFSSLRERISQCPGVDEVAVNPQIASALICCNCDSKTIFQYARQEKLFVRRQAVRANKSIFADVSDLFRSYNKQLKQLTSGEVDIPSVVFVSLVVSGIYEIARGNLVMPAWYTAFYYALQVFHRGKVDEFDSGENLLDDFAEADGD